MIRTGQGSADNGRLAVSRVLLGGWAAIAATAFAMTAIAMTAIAVTVTVAGAQEAERPVQFTRDVRPILAQHCYACHGPDAEHREADLRLDTREGLLAPRDGKPAVKARDVNASQLIHRVLAEAEDERMPPPQSGPRLKPEQIDILKRWIAQGADWQSHWSFEPVKRPALPKVQNTAWVRNPIDQFILARLEAEGLKPNSEADKRTLARRAALDLTGLPPPAALLDAYLQNDSPTAYETYVDELLKLPTYGERWARVWLDLARFADTRGYEKDRSRTIWRYRDWVIEAFNRDLPYDQFTIEQLAGDLLPNASTDQILATAFHRNTLVNEEGGTDDEEFRVAAVKDRVDTTIQVWMGLTMGCSKCHSHKYDPISQREYYQFYAFFNQTEDSDKGDERPTLPTPTRDQLANQERVRGELAELRRQYDATKPQLTEPLAAWLQTFAGRSGWSRPKPTEFKAASGATIKLLDDQSLLVQGAGSDKETYTVKLPLQPSRLTAIRLEAIPDKSLPKGGVGRSHNDGNFVLTSIKIETQDSQGQTVPLKISRAVADYAQQGYPVEHAVASPNPQKNGWAVSPQLTQPHQAIFYFEKPIELTEPRPLTITLDHQFEFSYPGFSLGRFRLSVTADESPTLDGDLPEDLLAIVLKTAEERTAAERQRLLDHYANIAPLTQPIRERIARKEAELKSIQPPLTPVLRELPEKQQRVTKVHVRGNFLEQSEVVEPATPASFGPLPANAPRNRLGVAQWLMHADNPLTARVAANRHWAQFFGAGLVDTQEDFGSQGQPPSHPELLDWLAAELREPTVQPAATPWSLKSFCRMIVTSATYRQSSRATSELLAKDPNNRLLARAPRPRLEAEMIRDNALAVAGLLSSKMYGPSVMPRQPDGIWRSTYNTDKWVTSPGEDKYRRGLYTFLKRTSPYPSMTTLDAPSREFCVIRRISTNTPLQALVTLNDPVYVEAAQGLARRAVSEGGATIESRLAFAFQRATLRPATAEEVQALMGLYERRLTELRAVPESAMKLATDPLGPLPEGWSVSELAALTAVCNVILNLDEFLTRG